MKILFVCPVLDIRYEWFLGFIEIQKQLSKHEVTYYIPYRKPVHIVENIQGRKAIEGNFDYVLTMNDDIWDVPDNTVEKLIGANKDFISCVMYAHGFPYQRCAFLKENKEHSLIDIADKHISALKEVTGTGIIAVDFSSSPFTLIKTEVFRKIPQPWYEFTETVPSDNYFCQKMLDNGIQPYVDMDLQVTHRGITFWNRTQRFLADCEFMIAMGQMDKNHIKYPSYEIVRDRLIDSYTKKKLLVL